MSAINNYENNYEEKQEKRDPESAIDGLDAGDESDGVLSFTALIEEGEN